MWSAIVAFLCAALLTFGGLSLRLSIAVYVLWGLLVWVLPKPKWGMGTLLGIAFALRGILWWMEPLFSDDIFRYVWEGQLAAAGGNPYLTPPSDFQPVDSAIHSQINHSDIPSIYPPVAMALFALVSSVSSTISAMKAFFLVVDIGCVWMLCRIGLKRGLGFVPAWLYALHPLAIVELSGSGHMDGLGIFFLLCAFLAVEHQRASAFWLLMGGGVKLLPAVLLPRVFSIKDRGLWLGVAVIFVLTLPFIQAPSALLTALSTYAQHWSFNGSVFAILFPVLGTWTRPILAGAGLLVLGVGLRKQLELCRLALWVCGASILLSPTVHPWYVLWAWVPALLCHNRAWTAMASLVPLSYVALLTLDENTGQWAPPLWPSLVIYGIFGGVAAAQFLQSRQVKTA